MSDIVERYRDTMGLTREGAIRRMHALMDRIEADAATITALQSQLAARDAEVVRLRGLVEDLYDEDDCYHDHHGYCQAHGWMATEPACPHKRARATLGDEQ